VQQRARTNTRVLTKDLITQMRGKIHTNGCSLFVQNESNTRLVLRTMRNYVCLVCGKWQYLYVYDTLQQLIVNKSKFVVVGPLLGKMFPSNLSIWLVARQNVSAQSINRIVLVAIKRTMYEYANYWSIVCEHVLTHIAQILLLEFDIHHHTINQCTARELHIFYHNILIIHM